MARSTDTLDKLTFDGHHIRTLTRSGQKWFATVDVLMALNYPSSSHGMVRSKLNPQDTLRSPYLGRRLSMVFASASGVLYLVGRSQKSDALRFQKWFLGIVTDAAKPTISALLTAPRQASSHAPLQLTADQLETMLLRVALTAAAIVAATAKGPAKVNPRDALKITMTGTPDTLTKDSSE